MDVDDAFSMEVAIERLGAKAGELCLNALFGYSRLTAHSVEMLGLKLWPYRISYGFTGGDLSLKLKACRAPIASRLNSGDLPVSISEKITTTLEASGSVTRSIEGAGGLSTKEGASLGGKSSDQTTSSDKSGSVVEITHNRALIHASGPDRSPRWRFEAANKNACLSGRAPGGGNPPLAILQFDEYPASVEATFSILPNDVEVTALNPGGFDRKWIPELAAARHALRKSLAKSAAVLEGCVIVSKKKIEVQRPAEAAA